MANTDVVLRDEMGLRVPGVPQVAVISANSVTFSVEEGANSALYFSPETASILSPKPKAQVGLACGQALNYSFTAPAHHAYGVIVQDPDATAPQKFEFGAPETPPTLVIQPGSSVVFTGPDNRPQT